MAFGALLVFMALGGLNFNNNLALLLVFTLAAIAFTTALVAYRNLRGLKVVAVRADPVFAGATARFRLHLDNPETRPRFAVLAGASGWRANDCADIPPLARAELGIDVTSHRRGWMPLPPVRLETRYPLGMFRAWSWLFPVERVLVYPAPDPAPPPFPVTAGGHLGQPLRGEGEQVHGLREYREGDSLRRVAWRTSARHEQLYTREMESPRERSCTLSWQSLAGIEHEQRIAILTAWVLQAESGRLAYTLELPGARLGPSQGEPHRSQCLEALALFGS